MKPIAPRALLLLTGSLLALSACQSDLEALVPEERPIAATARERVVEPRPWPFAQSDIPVDPRIRFGHFDNGLRWAWAENPEPEKRCYVRLHVDVGSLAEEEDERGMAHFLEHMAFNGSRNFEAGTLIEWFQEHGMSFGADTNAHTAFSETVYKLDLPDSDPETLREGLVVLRDFADGLLLEEEEVDAEKGVIDGEERERDSPGMRVMQQQLDIVFAGTRIGERLPIGLQEVRAAFTAESVRAFYERWYRPENMTLVLVGDIGELDPELLFEEHFADMQVPAEPWRPEPDRGRPRTYAHVYSIYEDEIPSVTIAVERIRPWEAEPLTVAEWLEDLPLQYARSLVGLRFHELAKEPDAPYLGASLSSSEVFEILDGEALTINCNPESWREALAFCEQELRRALEFGFQEAELAEARADALRSLDEAVEREPTAHSRGILGRILGAAESPFVPTDAATRREILRPAIEALTIEACHEALVQAWSRGELSISVVGDLDLGEDAPRELRAAYQASLAVPVEAGEEIEEQVFAYASEPAKAGTIDAREQIADLDFTRVHFANGVVLNVKRTDFKEKQILLSASLGEGKLTLEPDRSALEWVNGRAGIVTSGGLEAHSADDLRRLTAGQTVGVGFSVGADSFGLSGSTTQEDLLRECELMCAHLQHPGWREDGLVRLRRSLPLFYEGMKHNPQGPMNLEFIPALFSGDPRFATPSLEEATAIGAEELRAWLEPELREGDLEVTIVGDLDVEETVAAAARTFGLLPPRRDWRRFEERRTVPAPLTGLRQTHEIETDSEKSLVMLVFPVPDGLDTEVRRSFNVLNDVVNDRLRLDVRERLGAAYSPGAGVQQSQTHPGVGMLMIQAMSDPEKVDALVDACLEVAGSLASDGVSEEEIERLREPILNKRRDAKRTNGYWLSALSRSDREADKLADVRSADAWYEGYTAADIAPYAAEYLKPERASILIVNPQR